MTQLLGIIDNALIQGLGYGVAALGISLAFRVLRFPDLTADGSFLIGASALAALLTSGTPWPLALAGAAIAGAATGVVTALLNVGVGANPLLAGILTSMASYSVAFHLLGNRSNIGLLDAVTPFSITAKFDMMEPFASLFVHPALLAMLAVTTALVGATLLALLKSDLGLLLRAVGGNSALVESLGRSPGRMILLGLAAANGLAGLSGALVAAQQGFADVNMGVGQVITLIAGLVLGEEVTRRLGLDPGGLPVVILAPFVGMFLYFLLYLLVLRASVLGWLPVRIQPTDLRLLSAVVLGTAIALRSRRSGRESAVLPA